MRRQTNISVVKSCCLFSYGECMYNFSSILQCRWMCMFYIFSHTSSLPQRTLFLLFCVCSLENKIEEEEAIIAQPGLARLGHANNKCKQQEGVLWRSRESWVVVTSLWKRLQIQTGSLLCPGQNQNPNPDEPEIFSFFLIKSFHYLSLDAFLNWYFIVLIYKFFFPISTKGNLVPLKQGYTYVEFFFF